MPLPCKGEADCTNPPARPLRQMAFLSLRPPHCAGPELHSQPIDQSRQLTLAAWFLNQAILRGAQIFGPVGLKRERVEAEFGIERGGVVRHQALELSGLAAANRGCDRRHRDAAVNSIAGERHRPCADSASLNL